jgi:hypothetical protein
MDLSKLPKLSERENSAPPPPIPTPVNSPTPQRVADYQTIETSATAQIWLSAIIGLILLAIGRAFAQFLIAKLTGHEFHTGVIWQSGDLAGQEVSYFQLQGYTAFSDAAIFCFGLALILEAIVLAVVRRNTSANRALLAAALFITACTTAFNIVVAILLLQISILPLLSALAVAYGGYISIYEWQLLKRLTAESRA